MSIRKVDIIAMKAPQTLNVDKAKPYFPQAVKMGDSIYTSMILPLNIEGNAIVGKDSASQAKQCIKNLSNILDPATAALTQVLKLNIYVTNINEIAKIDPAIKEDFLASPPARTVICVSQLPYNVLVAVDAVAQLTKIPTQSTSVI